MWRGYNICARILIWPTILLYILHMNPSWSARVGLHSFQTVKPPFIHARGHMAICPGAEAVRGWRALNHPTVCTIGAVVPDARFFLLKECVSQVHFRGGCEL